MEKNTCAGQINPFLGANAPGNSFSGPYLPYAVARLGADTIYPQNAGGYQRGRPVKCISHLHVGGTGGAGRYGNIGVTAYPGPATVRPPYMELTGEQAQAGYYSACTRAGVRLELTSTQHTGVHRFSFPQGQEANVFIDAAAVIQTEGAFPGEHAPGAGHIAVDATGACIGGYVEQVSACEFCGRGDFIGGWGHRFPYSVCFFARFDRPARSVLLANSRGVYRSACAAGEGSCINASFGAGELELRVGVSFVSVANARAYVDDEAAQSFDALRQKAFDIWEQSVSRIRVTGGHGEERALFYSLFARLLAGPADLGVDQEFPLWKSGVRHFTDYYCLWDSVRNANSLLSLFDPEREAELLNCLLDVAEKTGWLPDAWIAGHSAMIQGGSSADILFCEAKEKGICGIDYEKALRYMRKNDEQPSPDTWLYGRYTEDYHTYGYLTSDHVPTSCVSRHLEYTYQDRCIGRLAQLLGKEDVAARYRKEAGKIWNLWRDDVKCFAPRKVGGGWTTFDPEAFSHPHHSFDPYYYEATGRCWAFHAWQDFPELMRRFGGAEAFIRALDAFFDQDQYDSKEMMLHVPWLYHYAGRPDLSVRRVRECMRRYFAPGPDGLADNEDMGCQSAFYMCAAMGVYPMMGQDLYLLGAPVFESVEVALGRSGKTLRIEAPAHDDGAFVDEIYLDGAPLGRAWIRHAQIKDGAVLRFSFSDVDTGFGRNTPPPGAMD